MIPGPCQMARGPVGSPERAEDGEGAGSCAYEGGHGGGRRLIRHSGGVGGKGQSGRQRSHAASLEVPPSIDWFRRGGAVRGQRRKRCWNTRAHDRQLGLLPVPGALFSLRLAGRGLLF